MKCFKSNFSFFFTDKDNKIIPEEVIIIYDKKTIFCL